VLRLVCEGKTSQEIGVLLHVSSKTVDTYRVRLMRKLGVGDVASLVRLAIREGVISAD
jgi:DNA-binding CsgD family transcriptional regulator